VRSQPFIVLIDRSSRLLFQQKVCIDFISNQLKITQSPCWLIMHHVHHHPTAGATSKRAVLKLKERSTGLRAKKSSTDSAETFPETVEDGTPGGSASLTSVLPMPQALYIGQGCDAASKQA